MKTYTVNDLAYLLNLDDSLQKELKDHYDSYQDGLKSEILTILWDNVHELKKRLADIKYEQYLDEVDNGNRESTSDLYQQAIRSVWLDFDKTLDGKSDLRYQSNQDLYIQMRDKREIQDTTEQQTIDELTMKLKNMTMKRSNP